MILPDLYPFTNGKRILYRRVKDIDYMKGEGNCTEFYFIDGTSFMENLNIGRHWARLKTFSFFFKIHRSFIVNLKAIRKIGTEGTITLNSGTEVNCAKEFLSLLLEQYPIVEK